MFTAWLNSKKAVQKELDRAHAAQEQEEVEVGPSLPQSAQHGKDGGNYGGFLRPGEGER